MEVLIFDHMEECTEAEVKRLLPLVPEWRREQALRYRYVSGQYCCLKSWVMLSTLLAKLHVGSDPVCSFTPEGKPFLADYPEIHFSISHCKAGIAVAVDSKPIGIDIEVRDRKPLFKPEDGSDFFAWWTRMEALVKMRGTGITDGWRETRCEPGETVETTETKQYIYSVARQENI